MFRRRHDEERSEPEGGPTVATGDSPAVAARDGATAGAGGVPAPTKALDQAYYNRAVANDQAIAAMRSRGENQKVPLESMTLIYEAAPDPDFEGFEELVKPGREWECTATVKPSGGEALVTRFLLYSDMGPTYPEVGDLVHVYFDPADPGVSHASTVQTAKSAVTWKVPARCPECGAPVDQSTESVAEHPTCHQCQHPLPCEPA